MQNLDTSWTLIKNDRKILAEIKFRSSRSLHIPKKKTKSMSRWQGPCHQVLDQRLWVLWRLRAWPQASRAFDRNGCWASWLFNRSISLMRLMRSSSPYLRDLWEEHASGALHADYSDSLWEDVKEEGTQGKKWAKWMPGFKRIREKDRLNNTLQN